MKNEKTEGTTDPRIDRVMEFVDEHKVALAATTASLVTFVAWSRLSRNYAKLVQGFLIEKDLTDAFKKYVSDQGMVLL